jgi:hypothetical protein
MMRLWSRYTHSAAVAMTEMQECRYCGAPLKRIYEDAAYELAWSHTSREDARACTGRKLNEWPVPVGVLGEGETQP